MLDFTPENISAEDVDRLRAVYEPLARSVRELVDATVRTRADADAVATAKAQIDSAAARLREKQLDGTFGVRYLASGERMAWGNAVIGICNPLAPPLVVNRDPSGKVWCEFHLGAAYEGPPGHVHGGVAALVLDHLLGEAASDGVNPRFTGTISLRYVRATRLGRLRAEAWTSRVAGSKTFAAGHLADDEGVTVQAEGVFILPRWLREQPGEQADR
ncbi:PaaI family thioesterase [Mycobacterium heckeshornense]|uniref:PaaI family thioesterase n=1 Tax=Mycobacterium heckeshornense TaxID=110505 RepID=UPI0006622D34|nr:PaaI family thioesterase [Mycobacterium heckeshornense]KMV23015.1 thioesterase [Mycobacterium heckeshornense]MCV7036105.1 PaaI family thioesterase [Mycobacterium heckeshornense]PIJ35690.1 PaaI family thioesterase [Mycobacterium heckeshornense]BCQ08992.1 thioesterase [Mycobacterium heckeshornense]